MNTQREIKFRAWDKQLQDFANMSNTSIAVGLDGKVFELFIEGSFRESNEYELMQYTGLKDKNGKEIYEGDVVVTRNRYGHVTSRRVIEFGELIDEVEGYKIKIGMGFNLHSSTDSMGLSDEVVGNIYENGDLLK